MSSGVGNRSAPGGEWKWVAVLANVDLWQDLDALTGLYTIHDKWIKWIQGT